MDHTPDLAAQSLPEGKIAFGVNNGYPVSTPDQGVSVAGDYPQAAGNSFKWYEKSYIHNCSLLKSLDIWSV